MSESALSDEFDYALSGDGLACWIRRDVPGDLFATFIRDPDRMLHDPSSRILKKGQKVQVVRQELRDQHGVIWSIIIKRYHYASVLRRVGFFLLSSPAFKCLKGALLLMGDGIDTARPVAAFEHRGWTRLGTSYYVAEEIIGSQPLPLFWASLSSTFPAGKRLSGRREVLREVASLFHRLHSHGIYHQDLKGTNILVRRRRNGRWRCSLVDVDGVWRKPRLGWSRRIKNLAQLYRTMGKLLSLRDELAFLTYYADLSLLTRKDRKTLAQKVLAVSRKGDLRSERKRTERGSSPPAL